jgi:hypothetical protein
MHLYLFLRLRKKTRIQGDLMRPVFCDTAQGTVLQDIVDHPIREFLTFKREKIRKKVTGGTLFPWPNQIYYKN